jgi:hypothetical protein
LEYIYSNILDFFGSFLACQTHSRPGVDKQATIPAVIATTAGTWTAAWVGLDDLYPDYKRKNEQPKKKKGHQ